MVARIKSNGLFITQRPRLNSVGGLIYYLLINFETSLTAPAVKKTIPNSEKLIADEHAIIFVPLPFFAIILRLYQLVNTENLPCAISKDGMFTNFARGFSLVGFENLPKIRSGTKP